MYQTTQPIILLHAGKPNRFWDDANKDFWISTIFLWALADAHNKL